MPSNTYTSPPALANIRRIRKFIQSRESVEVTQVMALLQLGEASIGGYLRHMARDGQVHCVKTARAFIGGSKPAKWAIGPGLGGHREASTAGLRQNVVVRKVWTGKPPALPELEAHWHGRAA